jgi:hypothetical protein
MYMPDSGDGQSRTSLVRRLERRVGEFLGIPQPGDHKRQQVLQDQLLPRFLEDARESWLLSWPQQKYLACVYSSLEVEAKDAAPSIKTLQKQLEEMRVLDLLEAVAEETAAGSLDLSVLMDRTPEHEVRILTYSGHPRGSQEFPVLLRKVIKTPEILARARQTLDQAANTTERQVNRIIGATDEAPEQAREPNTANRKLFSSLGGLFSGLVLLTADGAATPTVVCCPSMYLTLLSSFAGGISAVEKGIIDLGEEEVEATNTH